MAKVTLKKFPEFKFMEHPPVVISDGQKHYYDHHYVPMVVQVEKEVPAPPIIWPFLISAYFRLRLPVKRTYPFGFVPTTVFTGKYLDDIASLYPCELQASFKHQSNPVIRYWLGYIAALQQTKRASHRVTAQGMSRYLEPVPLRQTGKGNLAHPVNLDGVVKWLPSLHERLIDHVAALWAGTLNKTKP